MKRIASLLLVAAVSTWLGPIQPVTADGPDVFFFVGDSSGTRYFVKSNGDGTFGTMTPFAFGDGIAKGGAAADYDNDGDVDIVTCNNLASLCSLRKQLAPGSFEDPGTPANGSVFLPTAEEDGAAEDYNQDGHIDFVVSGDSAPILFTADGTGDFTHSTLPAAPGFSRGKDWADYDNDGFPDLFVGAAGGTVSLYKNTLGILSSPTTILSLEIPEVTAVAAADFDGDGIIDLAVGGGDASGTVSIYIGDGVGGFTHSHDLAPFGSTTSIDNYDFNEDGSQDLVAMPFFAFQPFYVENNGDGTFATAVGLDFTFDLALGIAAPQPEKTFFATHGTVFNDTDKDGAQDPGEVGIELVELSLTGTDIDGNAVNLAATSDVDGNYSFTSLPFANSAGYTLTITKAPADLVATTTETRTVRTPSDVSVVREHFGYAEPGIDLLFGDPLDAGPARALRHPIVTLGDEHFAAVLGSTLRIGSSKTVTWETDPVSFSNGFPFDTSIAALDDSTFVLFYKTVLRPKGRARIGRYDGSSVNWLTPEATLDEKYVFFPDVIALDATSFVVSYVSPIHGGSALRAGSFDGSTIVWDTPATPTGNFQSWYTPMAPLGGDRFAIVAKAQSKDASSTVRIAEVDRDAGVINWLTDHIDVSDAEAVAFQITITPLKGSSFAIVNGKHARVGSFEGGTIVWKTDAFSFTDGAPQFTTLDALSSTRMLVVWNQVDGSGVARIVDIVGDTLVAATDPIMISEKMAHFPPAVTSINSDTVLVIYRNGAKNTMEIRKGTAK